MSQRVRNFELFYDKFGTTAAVRFSTSKITRTKHLEDVELMKRISLLLESQHMHGSTYPHQAIEVYNFQHVRRCSSNFGTHAADSYNEKGEESDRPFGTNNRSDYIPGLENCTNSTKGTYFGDNILGMNRARPNLKNNREISQRKFASSNTLVRDCQSTCFQIRKQR